MTTELSENQKREDAVKPSKLALSIAAMLFPDGNPNMAYCWSSEERNEQERQRYRDFKARQFDGLLGPLEARVLELERQKAELRLVLEKVTAISSRDQISWHAYEVDVRAVQKLARQTLASIPA